MLESRAPAPTVIPLDAIRAARARLDGHIARVPLLPYRGDAGGRDVWLQLENLQPIGSFKLRGAGNRMLSADADELARGVVTSSAGNMAQGVAWHARRLGIACDVVVPDHAPRAKLDAIEHLGARTIPVSFERWWRTLVLAQPLDGIAGVDATRLFVHPVADAAVIEGNGTIGLEIALALEGVDTVLVPFGGGGLISGIASALRHLAPRTRVVACEVETAAPLAAALANGAPIDVSYTPSFVDGIGGKGILPSMWPLVSSLVDESIVVTLAEVAEAVRLLATTNRVVAEGAGAASLAAALSGRAGDGKIVCVVSGGNLDLVQLACILRGGNP